MKVNAENMYDFFRHESGCKAKKIPKRKVTKLKTIFDHQDGNSQRQVVL